MLKFSASWREGQMYIDGKQIPFISAKKKKTMTANDTECALKYFIDATPLHEKLWYSSKARISPVDDWLRIGSIILSNTGCHCLKNLRLEGFKNLYYHHPSFPFTIFCTQITLNRSGHLAFIVRSDAWNYAKLIWSCQLGSDYKF